MKNYVIITRVTAVLSIISLFLAIIIYYLFSAVGAEIWSDICLAIFGSALLTCITSIIGYIIEKRKALERFSMSTRYLLDIIYKYDVSWKAVSKIDFLLSYVDIDKSMWELQFNDIYFMNDFCKKKYDISAKGFVLQFKTSIKKLGIMTVTLDILKMMIVNKLI